MNYTVFLISAYLLGFLAAIPTGPVQVEVVRRSINGHLKTSLMVVCGAFTADVFYGSIAFFGIAPFLEEEKVMAVFWLAGGVILTVLGIVSIRHSLKNEAISYRPDHLKRKRWAFLGGLSLSATNPMMILWWLSGVKIFKDIGLITNFTSEIAVSFLCSRQPWPCLLSCRTFAVHLLGQKIHLAAHPAKDQSFLWKFSNIGCNIFHLHLFPCNSACILTQKSHSLTIS